ncbi:MAG: hypothetical protein ABIC95_03130 [archaeon]
MSSDAAIARKPVKMSRRLMPLAIVMLLISLPLILGQNEVPLADPMEPETIGDDIPAEDIITEELPPDIPPVKVVLVDSPSEGLIDPDSSSADPAGIVDPDVSADAAMLAVEEASGGQDEGLYYMMGDSIPLVGEDELMHLPVGDIVAIEDALTGQTDLYVELKDHVDIGGDTYQVSFSPREQGAIVLDVPVQWSQVVTVTNLLDASQVVSLNLMNYQDDIGAEFLGDVTEYEVFLNGEVVSDTVVVVLELVSLQSVDLVVNFRTPPVVLEKNCVVERVKDLIPSDATLVSSELDLNTALGELCVLRLHHDTATHYHDVVVGLDEFDVDSIESVYYVEGQQYLPFADGTIQVPALN